MQSSFDDTADVMIKPLSSEMLQS